MNFRILWDEKALAELKKLDVSIARRIAKKVGEMETGRLPSDVIRLSGSEDYRLRVGDYRVIFSISGQSIEVTKVGHRKNIYERRSR